MRNSVVSMVLGVILLFLSLIILPTYFIGVINWRNDLNTCQTAARNFVDMVIDNGQITDKCLSDLNLSLASCSSTFTYEFYREEKTTNPGATTGTSQTTWNHADVTTDTIWHTGDICTIVITQRGSNPFQKIAQMILGTSYSKIEVRLSGMVR